MKITDWVVYTPDVERHVFIELLTDEGVSGWGAVFSSRLQSLGALDWLKKFVIGENPMEVERVTEKLHQITYWFGRGGAMTHAIKGMAANLAADDLHRASVALEIALGTGAPNEVSQRLDCFRQAFDQVFESASRIGDGASGSPDAEPGPGSES